MNNAKANKEEVNNMTLVTSLEVVVASISTMEDMVNLNKRLSLTYLRTLM